MQDKSSAAAYASDEGTEEIVIPLRPHHGMCLAYFKGEGYSNGFTAHMAEMLKIFLEGKKIRLHVDTDEICSACPNNLGGHCEAGDKVAEYDNAVLEKCGLKAGQTLHFSEFTKKSRKKSLRQINVRKSVETASGTVSAKNRRAAGHKRKQKYRNIKKYMI